MTFEKKLSLEEITKFGREFYFAKLKDSLEKDHWGEFAVIDVAQEKYVVDPDRFTAIRKADREFGEKIFYIVQIGNLQRPTRNVTVKNIYAWNF